MDNIKRAPKPDYCKCNKGHTLTEIYNEGLNMYIWDCQTCINYMEAKGYCIKVKRKWGI